MNTSADFDERILSQLEKFAWQETRLLRGNFTGPQLPKQRPPSTPEPGIGWGPFQYVAKWLLRAQSQSLALISGMLGVGLFGATVSSLFSRKRTKPEDDTENWDDFAAVIFGGFAAAVVIFLAVKGGLAVFAFGKVN